MSVEQVGGAQFSHGDRTAMTRLIKAIAGYGSAARPKHLGQVCCEEVAGTPVGKLRACLITP
jgi:hypothetical protein